MRRKVLRVYEAPIPEECSVHESTKSPQLWHAGKPSGRHPCLIPKSGGCAIRHRNNSKAYWRKYVAGLVLELEARSGSGGCTCITGLISSIALQIKGEMNNSHSRGHRAKHRPRRHFWWISRWDPICYGHSLGFTQLRKPPNLSASRPTPSIKHYPSALASAFGMTTTSATSHRAFHSFSPATTPAIAIQIPLRTPSVS